MRILLLATCPFVFNRGKSLSIYSLVLALTDCRHNLTVLTYAHGNEINLSNVEIVRIPRLFKLQNPHKTGFSCLKAAADFALFIKAQQILKHERYDLILAEDIDGALMATALKKKFKIPVVMHLHGIFSELMQSRSRIPGYGLRWLYDLVERKAWLSADHLVCIWPHIKKRVQNTVPSLPATTIIDAPPESVLTTAKMPFPATSLGANLQKKLQGQKIIIYVGNFEKYQNFEVALHGMKCALQDGLTETKLLVVGGNYKRYEKLAEKIELGNDILFIGGTTPEEAIDLMRLADICLSLIISKGNPPSKIIHYFLAEKPIYACYSEANQQLLTHDKNACFFKNTAEKFASGLIALLGDQQQLDRLSRASRKEARRYAFNTYKEKWQKITGKYIER